MDGLEQLRADHAAAVLAFERANRAYFASSISDRGDDFFARFPQHHGALLAEQQAGTAAFYVLTDEAGAVLGRFNLYNIEDGSADVGYRVAQHAAGRGVATQAVRQLCTVARELGLTALRAAASTENLASRRVLTKAGFVPIGAADPVALGGKPGIRYRRDLASDTGTAGAER